jgi:hypothetical protein
MSNPLLHKIEQTAERLQRSPRKVHYLIAEGELEVVHDGRSVRVVVASEDAYVERLRQRETARRAAKAEAKTKGRPAIPSTP